MAADCKAIVRSLYEEVWNKRRLELVDEIISPSHALHDPNVSGSAIGPRLTNVKLRASSWLSPICAFPSRIWLLRRKK